MTEWILYLVILRRVCVIPLQWVLPMQSESNWLISVQFNFHSALLWSISIMLRFCGRCVYHFREPSVSWYSQTASDWLAAVGAWWDQGTISVLSVCMCKACTIAMHIYCMYTHEWLHIYMCSACASIFLCACETDFCITASWMCACIYCLLWASRLLRVSL